MTTTSAIEIPAIGQPWPEQGGIYIGSLIKDGTTHHLITPGGTDHDIEDVSFHRAEESVKGKGEINGCNDWRVPDQRELMLAYINAPDLFDKDDWYWTSSQHSELDAWAFNFEYGFVDSWFKSYEFRVRPFRSIIASTI